MAAAQSWANLPDRLLVGVSAFLRCRADRVHMAAVNKHWRATVTGRRDSPPPLPPQLPWLIFPSTVPPTFYSPLSRRYHRLHGLPADVVAARYCGSSDGGWLVLALPAPHGYALYNIYSGHRIPLPSGFRYPSSNASESPLVVHAATLSASPSQGRPYAVAAIAVVDDRPTAAFWSPGRDSWFSTRHVHRVLPQDVIYFQGAFVFVFPGEELILFVVAHGAGGEVTLTRREVDLQRRDNYGNDVENVAEQVGRMKSYLVQSRGKLLMVVRFVYGAGHGTDFLRVFLLRVKDTNANRLRGTWVEIKKLDGRMLFLGPGCSRSFEVALYDGFRECEAYYLEERFGAVPAVDDDEEVDAAGAVPAVDDDDEEDDAGALSEVDDHDEEDAAGAMPAVDDDDEEDAAGAMPEVDDDDEEDAAGAVPAVDDNGEEDAAGAADIGSVHDDLPDTGTYHMVNKVAEEWPPEYGPRSDVPPIWWLH